jgi:hypothetical protein
MTDPMTATVSHLPPPDVSGLGPDDPWLAFADDLLAGLIDRLRSAGTLALTVVPTGIDSFDGADGGLAPGTLTVVCARRAPDRTSALLAAALHAAGDRHPSIVYALGSPAGSVAAQLAAVALGVELASQPSALEEARRRVAGLPLRVVVGQTVSSHDIRAQSLTADDPPELIVVDNLTLLAHAGRGVDLKHLAVDLHVAVIASTTVPASLERLDGAGLGADLLNAADRLVWAPVGNHAAGGADEHAPALPRAGGLRAPSADVC